MNGRGLRVTPAMAAGLAGRLWDMRDIVALVEAAEGGVIGRRCNRWRSNAVPPVGNRDPTRALIT